jgi:uncharacterized membrane protein YfcA
VDQSVVHLVYGAAIVFAAGIVKGLTGFGFALVVVPVLVILFDPKSAIPVIVMLNAASNVPLYFHSRKSATPRHLWPLIAAGMISIPVGTYLLISLDTSAIRAVVGLAVCVFALAFLMGFRRQIKHERSGFVGAGLISGVLNGLISTGGPPAILFLSNQGMARDRFRANLITYFLFQNAVTIVLHVSSGLVSRETLRLTGVFVPTLAVGLWVGTRLVRRVPETTFRKAVLAIVLITGLMAVLSSAGLV